LSFGARTFLMRILSYLRPRLTVTTLQSAVFLVNSRYPLLSAAQLRFGSKSLHDSRPTFFRSYGGNLQSSLRRILSSALGYSPDPPVSVYGTGTPNCPLEAFLGSVGSARHIAAEALISSSHLGVKSLRLWHFASWKNPLPA